MAETKRTYVEEKLDIVVNRTENVITFVFQNEKIKLDHIREIMFLKDLDPTIQKEIRMENDELSISHTIPASYIASEKLNIGEKERLITALQLVHRVQQHRLSRIHLVVSPGNIVFDQGLSPHFLHYGVKESLPPYEKDGDTLFKETKAMAAFIADPKRSFDDYIKFSETIKLSDVTRAIMETGTFEELEEVLNKSILDAKEVAASYMSISKKKWKTNRYILLGVSILLVPAIIYSIYSFFFINPKQESIVSAQENFLLNKYSDVVTELEPYEIDDIPKVAQYQLALSYIVNESLSEDQKENVRNTISLQSDPMYYEYWINIGRGKAKEALDTARFLEDRDLILFGLLKYREQVKSDSELDSEERQQKLNDIEGEINEYEEEMKKLEEEKAAEEEQAKEADAAPQEEQDAGQQEKEAPKADDQKKEDQKKEQQKKDDKKTD